MAASMNCHIRTLLFNSKVCSNKNILNNFRSIKRWETGSATTSQNSPDIERIFIKPEVQKILKSVTGFNLEKIFRAHFADLKTPKYKLLTESELEEVQDKTVRQARGKLWMPPVMNARPQEEITLSEDKELENHDDASYVFTDITYGIPDYDRVMVVRETDGRLRTASADERDKLLNIYFPREGRMYKMPQMFEEKQLEHLLELNKHLYLLDRACIQFEPNDHNFLRVTRRVYEHLSQHEMFDLLHSTRHFGPMSLYLTFYNTCENLLVYMIQNRRPEDAVKIVRLHNIIYPNTESAKLSSDEPTEKILKVFAEKDLKHGEIVSLALQALLESQQTSLADRA